jgi:hypothetical protein
MNVRPLMTVSGIDANDPRAKPQVEIPRAQLDRDFTGGPRKRGPRLPRNPGSLIISATKGWPATCATGF